MIRVYRSSNYTPEMSSNKSISQGRALMQIDSDLSSTSAPEVKKSNWLWNTFRLIPPQAYGKSIQLGDVTKQDVSIVSEIDSGDSSMSLIPESITKVVEKKGEIDEKKLTYSVPGLTMAHAVWQWIYGYDNLERHIQGFSNETLINIISPRLKLAKMSRKQLVTEVYKTLHNPMRCGSIEVHVKFLGVRNLLTGILYDGNWAYLSKDDLQKWITSYSDKSGDTAGSSSGVEGVIQQQNIMLKEIANDKHITLKGRKIAQEFIMENQ